jgi:predicted nucleic acid-binding protein
MIEFYKENSDIVAELKRIGQDNIAVSVVTAGELIYGARDKKELKQIQEDTSRLKRIDIDAGINDLFWDLMNRYSLSHGIEVPDAFIATTALFHDIPLYTLNVKDFRFISGLKRHP